MPLQIDNVKGETVVDPYKRKECFERNYSKWLARFDAKDRVVVERYISDMRLGRNVTGVRGPRGYAHVISLVLRLLRIAALFRERFSKGLMEVTADDIHQLFDEMKNGTIRTTAGRRYLSTHDYIKVFKAFWNWHRKVERRAGNRVENITIDLSGSPDHKPEFVYFTLESLQRMLDEAKLDYRVLMLFLFDSGIRAPTELMNVKRKDLRWDERAGIFELQIRDEVAKTFGRRIKLMLCSQPLRSYIEKHRFAPEDFLFTRRPFRVNVYLRRLSMRVFGENLERLEENRGNKSLTMYDFRHSSCCYWLPRYKSESALKYRFGWKQTEEIHYYSEFLGMKDTIAAEDMLVDVTKTDLENQLNQERKEREILQERLEAQQRELREQLKQMERLLLEHARCDDRAGKVWWSGVENNRQGQTEQPSTIRAAADKRAVVEAEPTNK